MIKVLIVDDQKTVQEILKSYIEADPTLEFVGCADNGQEAIDLIGVRRLQVVLHHGWIDRYSNYFRKIC